ncbi:hypothetical protein AGDE_04389 [Angomonas deanei]|nr:hypothetical protein AGDE_04389 [Angomonas deanei]|eukprot:EPY39539.1 hypothetical protein AGDE_04389 [Angomonas deanei]
MKQKTHNIIYNIIIDSLISAAGPNVHTAIAIRGRRGQQGLHLLHVRRVLQQSGRRLVTPEVHPRQGGDEKEDGVNDRPVVAGPRLLLGVPGTLYRGDCEADRAVREHHAEHYEVDDADEREDGATGGTRVFSHFFIFTLLLWGANYFFFSGTYEQIKSVSDKEKKRGEEYVFLFSEVCWSAYHWILFFF